MHKVSGQSVYIYIHNLSNCIRTADDGQRNESHRNTLSVCVCVSHVLKKNWLSQEELPGLFSS